MKSKVWAVAACTLLTTLAACDNKSERKEASDAVEKARRELEETRLEGEVQQARMKKAEYDSAKADYEKMNNPAKRDTTKE